jgi:hypothetical protein
MHHVKINQNSVGLFFIITHPTQNVFKVQRVLKQKQQLERGMCETLL